MKYAFSACLIFLSLSLVRPQYQLQVQYVGSTCSGTVAEVDVTQVSTPSTCSPAACTAVGPLSMLQVCSSTNNASSYFGTSAYAIQTIYPTSGCTGTYTSLQYVPINTCISLGSVGSALASLSGGAITVTEYTDSACTQNPTVQMTVTASQIGTCILQDNQYSIFSVFNAPQYQYSLELMYEGTNGCTGTPAELTVSPTTTSSPCTPEACLSLGSTNFITVCSSTNNASSYFGKSTYLEAATYLASGCTGSFAEAEYLPVNTCISIQSLGSAKVTYSGGVLTLTQYTDAACQNNATVQETYTSSQIGTCIQKNGEYSYFTVYNSAQALISSLFMLIALIFIVS